MKEKILRTALLPFVPLKEFYFSAGFAGGTTKLHFLQGKLRHGKGMAHSKLRVTLDGDEHPGGDSRSCVPPLLPTC